MIFTNELLEKMDSLKNDIGLTYGSYYFKMAREQKENYLIKKFSNKSNRICTCRDFWDFNVYHFNKLMDLNKVNLCHDRFCPNCRKIDLAKFIYKFKPIFSELSSKYVPYFCTLTIPNCEFYDLRKTVDDLYKNFYKFYQGFSRDLVNTTRKGFAFRDFRICAGLKVLEITYNEKANTFHPHLHCIFFLDPKELEVLKFYDSKHIKGLYSNKRQSFNLLSHMDIHISKVWTMINQKVRLTSKTYDNFDDNFLNYYQCDMKKVYDHKALYEVIKYTFKDTDISNYEVFKEIFNCVQNRRIRQGYGLLFDLKTEEVEVGEVQELTLDFEEVYQNVLVRSMKELYTDFKEYQKISRYCPDIKKELSNIESSNRD